MILLIVDIDGTLVDAEGAALRAMNATIQELFGITNAMAGEAASHFGMTDPQLLSDAYKQHQLPLPPDWPLVEATYHRYLADDLVGRPGHAMVGAKAFIQRMALRPSIGLAIGSGNFQKGAYLKLGAHQMAGYFPVGGFGEDGPERSQVMAAALAHARDYYEEEFTNAAVVIGDTPLDIEGAHKIELPCLSVGAAHYTVDQLKASGADMAVPSLAHADDALAGWFGDRWKS